MTEKFYILPEKDSLNMPVIRVPCYISHVDDIDLTFPTEEDAKVYQNGCPKCGCKTLMASSGNKEKHCVSHWMCHICFHRWDTERGIRIIPAPVQMKLFEEKI